MLLQGTVCVNIQISVDLDFKYVPSKIFIFFPAGKSGAYTSLCHTGDTQKAEAPQNAASLLSAPMLTDLTVQNGRRQLALCSNNFSIWNVFSVSRE